MNIKTPKEVESFFKVVDKCEGQVEFRTQWGDIFNLHSTLSRSIVPTIMLSEQGKYLELFCYNKEDEQRFFGFFNENPNVI